MAESFGVASALAIISLEGLLALLILWAWGKSMDINKELDKRLAE